jgi:K+-transporting ATPase ATPase A chain
MSANGYVQLLIYGAVLLALVQPLGAYMARIFEGQPALLNRIGAPLEKLLYRICGVDPAREMRWTQYALALLAFNLLGAAALYILQRVQWLLPFNPRGFAAVPPDLAFNTAAGFITTADWQSYAGEATLSYLVQMAGLSVQNFLAAASGIAVLLPLIRGFARQNADTVGNF